MSVLFDERVLSTLAVRLLRAGREAWESDGVLHVRLPLSAILRVHGPWVTPAGYARFDVTVVEESDGQADFVETVMMREADSAALLARVIGAADRVA